jgi:hypothetical protein
VPFILVRLERSLTLLDRIWKNTEISNFMKILPLGAELFYTDGQTDTKKLTVALRNFGSATKHHSSFTRKRFFSPGSEKQLVAFSLLLHFLYYRLSLADSPPLPSKFILHNNRYNTFCCNNSLKFFTVLLNCLWMNHLPMQ